MQSGGRHHEHRRGNQAAYLYAMIHPYFRRWLFGSVLAWMMLGLAFAWVIDPYGVSPIRVTLAGVNEIKPKRLDIDRLIKPYEVWRYQPRTVFVGTSRVHQSIDPSALDGTKFAPAYNASIPAGSLSMNISHLQQYLELDHRLHTVMVELFIYNFLGQPQDRAPKTWSDFAGSLITLLASANTLWDSISTLTHNTLNGRPTYEIKRLGYFYYPPGHNAKGPFDGFPAGIWSIHSQSGGTLKLYEPAFDTFRDLIALARAHDIEMVFLATPNHAYFDYYIDAIGAWDVVETWLTRLSAQAPVISFSQPNAWVYEPVRESMDYWNDPFHFSLNMGRGMQATLAGESVAGLPEDFMVRLTPEMVPAHIEARRQAVRRWAQDNPTFVARFEEERRKWQDAQDAAATK
jgi:hypothetical protein